MENQVLHTVWCNISGEAAGDIWNWSLLGVEGLSLQNFPASGLSSIKHYHFGGSQARWRISLIRD